MWNLKNQISKQQQMNELTETENRLVSAEEGVGGGENGRRY